MNASDFELTGEQLDNLNRIIQKLARVHGECGEDPADSLTVTFEFSPFGRAVYLRYTGGPYIEIASDY